MIIADTLEKMYGMSYDHIMKEMLFDNLGLINTTFRPKPELASGNGNELGLVHDSKARAIESPTGHAGLFTNSRDLIQLSNGYFNGYLDHDHLDRIGEMTFPNSRFFNKGNLGVYVKTPQGLDNSYTSELFSNGSFSHQGWTGAVAAFDLNNKIHNSILVNAVHQSSNPVELKNDKPLGYVDAFKIYQKEISYEIMLMYVVKKFYSKYYDTDEEVVVPEDFRDAEEIRYIGSPVTLVRSLY